MIVYEVGTKVKLVTKRKAEGRLVSVPQDMADNWYGKEVTITNVIRSEKYPAYEVKENEWCWDNSLIECVVEPELFSIDDDSDINHASFGRFFDCFAIKK